LAEDALYQALWNSGRQEEGRESRVIRIGWRGMAALCRLTPKNCKINARRLIRKLAIEPIGPYDVAQQTGTTYRLYSYAAILDRRRKAGLEYVVRHRGVDFVDPHSGSPLLKQSTPGVEISPGSVSGGSGR
jgi:hypothetical protein